MGEMHGQLIPNDWQLSAIAAPTPAWVAAGMRPRMHDDGGLYPKMG